MQGRSTLNNVSVNLKNNYAAVCAEIDKAKKVPGRKPGPVNLLAVSKKQSSELISELHQLGQHDFAENYLQEALEKQEKLRGLDIVWHFIGRIQSRKAKIIAENFSWVYTVENEKVISKLDAARSETGLDPMQVCLQVNISCDPSKGGAMIEEASSLCKQINASPNLQLRGLMTILKAGLTQDEVFSDYKKMTKLFVEINEKGYSMDCLSMGMSADFPLAILAGANWVRVGEALFGERQKSVINKEVQ